ncbi:hypothetical protein [Marivivens donghaensis]|uniref:hypothetical protein n=1 Tax=Marivivens donghaensis TaxID=1699413 RepID=UPI00201EE7C8|nr:hypothetical protein [Marivivens donghaensis]MCL7408917.1 hypothetical protein [Marivivens donghaensis]MDN3703785.1 hypothetical protein [Marivivens donghaensis]
MNQDQMMRTVMRMLMRVLRQRGLFQRLWAKVTGNSNDTPEARARSRQIGEMTGRIGKATRVIRGISRFR